MDKRKKDQKTLTAKEAAQNAAHYLVDLVDNVSDVLLEEVERDDGVWRITLSYQTSRPPLMSFLQRDYKLFEIDAITGDVKSMRIRKV